MPKVSGKLITLRKICWLFQMTDTPKHLFTVVVCFGDQEKGSFTRVTAILSS